MKRTQLIAESPITFKELTRALDVTPMTIYAWRNCGLPCIVGRRGELANKIGFLPSAVAQWLAENRPQYIQRFKDAGFADTRTQEHRTLAKAV